MQKLTTAERDALEQIGRIELGLPVPPQLRRFVPALREKGAIIVSPWGEGAYELSEEALDMLLESYR